MTAILTNHAFTLYVDRTTRVVRYVRTTSPYASLDEFEQIHAAVLRTFDQLGRERHALLLDMRAAVMNPDPAFEQAVARLRPNLTRGFTRVALLVRTAVGALQVNRMLREDGVKAVRVYQDETAALAYLVDADAEPQRRSGIIETVTDSSRTPDSSRNFSRGSSVPPRQGGGRRG